jgi:hypothetical protein
MTMYEPNLKFYRTPDFVRREKLWPTADRDVPGTIRRRLSALEEVLRRLPPAPYAFLIAHRPQFQWQVDNPLLLGQVCRPAPASASVVQLAEALEHGPEAVVVTVVAHELAHVVLQHAPGADPCARTQHEIDAWNALYTWGFRADADLAEFLLRHQGPGGNPECKDQNAKIKNAESPAATIFDI